MLDSKELEIVQLGATLMSQQLPKERWETVLQAFCYDQESLQADIYVKKWDWKIDGDNIIIKKYDSSFSDIWALKQKVSMPLYNLTQMEGNIKYVDSDKFTWILPTNDGART